MILKFRAWNTQVKKMYKIGQLTIDEFASWNFESGRNEEIIGVSPFLQPHIKIMQSIGLKDKNGVEIYEGDIVKPLGFASWIGVVAYSKENAACILDDHNNDFRKGENIYLSEFAEGLEIIGNIYENPELLKK